MNTVISIENVSKSYQLGTINTGTFYGDLNRWWAKLRGLPDPHLKIGERDHGNRDGETLWALKDVNFQVQQGEALGIIGRNGAGKSTLLKILSRVTAPSSGEVKVKGRIASLLEVGTGFHPELTGRENIYLNGAILGMRKAEIARRFDEIVNFSGVEKYIDTPVKRYSSGMYVRLAFAVAAHLEPEILVVDEVLAVGDAEFQKKCLGKMGDVAGEGRTVIFVSHNLNAIWSLCSKSIWLDRGTLKSYSVTSEIISDYRSSMHLEEKNAFLTDNAERKGNGKIRITKLYLMDPDGIVSKSTQSGTAVDFLLEYSSDPELILDNVEIYLFIVNDRDERLFVLTNKSTGERFIDLPRQGQMKCHVPNLPLVPGEYSIQFSCLIRGELADKVLFASKFTVIEGDFYGTGILPQRSYGDVLVQHTWQVESIQVEAIN